MNIYESLKCKTCGANLKFDIVKQKMKCEHCGNLYPVDSIDYQKENSLQDEDATEDLFEGLSIWQDETYRQIQGTYPVISLSFANVKEKDYESTEYRICQLMEDRKETIRGRTGTILSWLCVGIDCRFTGQIPHHL